MDDQGPWRIGELASRVGVSVTLLRAWEVRYGLFTPTRSLAGWRGYGPADERRALAMVAARDRGVPASRAAASILAEERYDHGEGATSGAAVGDEPAAGQPRPGPTPSAAQTIDALLRGMEDLDAPAMHHVLDLAAADRSVEELVGEVLMPFLQQLGDRWEGGLIDVADEHFASEVVRDRLGALALRGQPGVATTALLACAPGEHHELALKSLEVLLQRRGWHTRYLGADTPLKGLVGTVRVLRPRAVVVSAATADCFVLDDADRALVAELSELCAVHVGGAGASPEVAAAWGATHLAGDVVGAARALTASPDGRRTAVDASI